MKTKSLLEKRSQSSESMSICQIGKRVILDRNRRGDSSTQKTEVANRIILAEMKIVDDLDPDRAPDQETNHQLLLKQIIQSLAAKATTKKSLHKNRSQLNTQIVLLTRLAAQIETCL